MTKRSREAVFEKAAQKCSLLGPNFKMSKGYGASNALMVVDLGLELLDADLVGVKEDHDSFLLMAGTMLPPKDELYVAVYIKSDAKEFHNRLKSMLEYGLEQDIGDKEASGPPCNVKNNNCAILVAWEDGNLYIRNKGHWIGDAHSIKISDYGPGIKADRVSVAVYPPSRDAARSLNIRTYISYIARLFRQEKVNEIHPWETTDTDFEHFKVNLNDLDLAEIRSKIEALGVYYSENLVDRFHIALNYLPNKHFVILAGLSGTGKTSLAIRYSQAVHGIDNANEKDPFLFMCRVRPDWTDPTGLLGYHDIVSNKYIVPEFLEAILTAHAYPNIPVIVCLDEMNLARVEYYFSDILSCMESAPESHINLHHNSIPMEGSNGEDIPSSLPVPPNLYVVGTINIDETTSPLSDKVLDRATVIDMSLINIEGFLINIQKKENGLKGSVDELGPVLIDIGKVLAEHGLGFGYRTIEEALRYHAFAVEKSSEGSQSVIDHLLCQKLLTKLRGTERQRAMLDILITVLSDYPMTLEFIKRLIDELDEMGGFQALR